MGTPIENNTNKINSFNQKLDNFFSSQGAAAPAKPLGSMMLIQNAYHIQHPVDFNNIIVCFLDDFLGYSTNGADWNIANDTNLGYGEKYITVNTDNSMILAGSYSCSTLFLSIDGKTWIPVLNLPSGIYPTQIYFINGYFYVLRTDGYYSYSTNGHTWNHYNLLSHSKNSIDPLTLMQYNPILSKYLFVSEYSVYVVANPTNENMIEVTWVDWNDIYSESVYNITCFKGIWIASASWSLFWSSDGVTWNRYDDVGYWEDSGDVSFYQTDDTLFINENNMICNSYYTLDGLTLHTPNEDIGHNGSFYLTSIKPDNVIFYDGNNYFGWGYHNYTHLDEYISHYGLFISSDLINWALVEDDHTSDASCRYDYDNGMYLKCNLETAFIYFSNDRQTWVQSNLMRGDIVGTECCFLYRFNKIIMSFIDMTYTSYQLEN